MRSLARLLHSACDASYAALSQGVAPISAGRHANKRHPMTSFALILITTFGATASTQDGGDAWAQWNVADAPQPEAPAPTAPTTQGPTRLIVLDLVAHDVDPALVQSITEGVAVTLQHAAIADDVVTAADLRAVLDVEAERQRIGECVDDSCVARVAEALRADLLLHGSVGRMGAAHIVTLNLFDAKRKRAVIRERIETEKLELLSRDVTTAAERIAFAYQGKPVPLANATPKTSDNAMLWVGVGGAALGAAGTALGIALAATAASTLEDTRTSGAEKASALSLHPFYLGGALGSALLMAAGATVAVASVGEGG
jgi:hypothetical protein